MSESARSQAWRPFAHRGAARIAAALLVLATALVFVLQALAEPTSFLAEGDRAWRDRMVAAEGTCPLAIARALEVIGGAWVTVPLRVVVAMALWWRGFRTRFGLWLVAVVSAETLALVSKGLYGKARPAEALSHTVNTAFPSGHTTTAAVMAFGLVLVLTKPGRRRVLAAILAAAWPVAMAWSRTFLRDHWLSDVTAGFLLGTTCAVLAGLLAGRFPTRPAPPPTPGCHPRSGAG